MLSRSLDDLGPSEDSSNQHFCVSVLFLVKEMNTLQLHGYMSFMLTKELVLQSSFQEANSKEILAPLHPSFSHRQPCVVPTSSLHFAAETWLVVL